MKKYTCISDKSVNYQNIFDILETMKNYSQNIIIFLSLLLLPLWAEAQSDTPPLSSDHNETIPNVPSFTLDFNSENLVCYPSKFIRSKTHKHFIEFLCMNKKISVLPADHKTDTDSRNKKGRDETNFLRREALEKGNTGTVYKVQIPQDDARSPKTASRIAKQQLNNGFYGKYARMILPAKFYASIRPQIAHSGSEDGASLNDAGSRAGFFYYYSFDSGYDLTLQYEATINWNNEQKFINLSEISDSSRRLSFISLQKEGISVLFGKYWSAYYDIAQFTDLFMAFGAVGSGAFNNNGDGSASGTGRPNNMLQLYMDKETYSTTLQYQLQHSSDGKEYRYGTAGSFVYKGWEDSKVGASVALGKFKKITETMRDIGIDGDDISWITGVSYQKEKFTVNAVLSYTKNHMNDDQGNYFDGIGTELYLRYDATESIRLVGGINTLIPTNNDYKGEFNIKKFILSAQYTFGEKTFDDLVYIEVSAPQGNLANGDKAKRSVAIGLRYLFDSQ